MVKIFVGNVSSSTTEPELRALFEKFGPVSDCDILKNYGFVHMDEEEAAQKAVSELHKHELNGSRITVEYATTKVRNATKIYVGNVPEGVTAAKIKELFQPFGKVVECDIVKNYAFVHMQRESEALEAISELNHSKLEGQKIFVSLSRSNQAKNGRADEYLQAPPPHYPPHPHYHSARPPPGEYYPLRGRLPPPPPPPLPPPPRAYYERDAYERRHDPYAAAALPYYDRDPYDSRPPLPQRPLSPGLSSRYYRDRSPPGRRRALLPPPPPAGAYAPRGYARTGPGAAPPLPPTAPSAHYQRYSVSAGYDKDDYYML